MWAYTGKCPPRMITLVCLFHQLETQDTLTVSHYTSSNGQILFLCITLLMGVSEQCFFTCPDDSDI